MESSSSLSKPSIDESFLYPSYVNSFALWNNKGGVGKSTLTFQIASECALANPEDRVILFDLCPQSNSTTMFFGGSEQHLETAIEEKKTVFDFATQNATIISSASSTRDKIELQELDGYLTQPSEKNHQIPKNLCMLCGSPELSDGASFLENVANTTGMKMKQLDRWTVVHTMLRLAIKNYAMKHRQDNQKFYIFIDTNPSFAIYTAIGIAAADKIVVPAKADDASRIGFKYAVKSIHGPNNLSISFHTNAVDAKLPLPKVALIIANQLNRSSKGGSAKAYKAMGSGVIDVAYDIYSNRPDVFLPTGSQNLKKREFTSRFQCNMKDTNTFGIIGCHFGTPARNVDCKKYTINKKDIVVDKKQKQSAVDNIRKIVNKLLDPTVVDDDVLSDDDQSGGDDDSPATLMPIASTSTSVKSTPKKRKQSASSSAEKSTTPNSDSKKKESTKKRKDKPETKEEITQFTLFQFNFLLE